MPKIPPNFGDKFRASLFYVFIRSGARTEEQRSHLQVQRHSSENVNVRRSTTLVSHPRKVPQLNATLLTLSPV